MEVYLIVVSVVLLLVFTAVFIDLLPLVLRWLSRIHIGQWQSNGEWQNAAENALLTQLIRTPRIPLSENTRLTVIERLKGKYSSKTVQMWQQGSLLLGANSMCECGEVKKQIENFIASKINTNGEWRKFEAKPDSAMLAFAVLNSPVSDKNKVKPAMDATADMLFRLAEQTGTVPYNTNMPDVRFVDTVGMICPFLVKYAFKYDSMQALVLAKNQIQDFIKFGLHDKLHIPVHCYNAVTGVPLGIYGWGRGCGWWAVGLMDTYLILVGTDVTSDCELLKEEKNIRLIDEMRAILLQEMKGYANALTVFQMKTGPWDRQIFLMTSGESSATAMLAWYMKKLFEITQVEKYRICSEKAVGYLISVTKHSGAVDCAQGDTKGIGFYSDKLDEMPAAQAFMIRSMPTQ